MSTESDGASDVGSVTNWVSSLKAGDNAAAQALWERYFARLVAKAHQAISHRRRFEDEEDAALSAFDSFCVGVRQGRFPFLSNRYNLWWLLLKIVRRKALDQNARGCRIKRDETRTLTEAELVGEPNGDEWFSLDCLPGPDPSPEFAAMLAEEYEHRMDALGDDSLRQIALMRLEGYTDGEIAERLGCTRRTVQRRLEIIRAEWADS